MIIKVENIEIYYKFFNEEYLNYDKPVIVFLHEGLGSIDLV